jgi:hypothetical protein
MASPMASSSQPTGWPGRRAASTAPTVAALSAATARGTPMADSAAMSARPAWPSSRSTHRVPANPATVSAQTVQASAAGHRRGHVDRVTAPIRADSCLVSASFDRGSVPGFRPGSVTGW